MWKTFVLTAFGLLLSGCLSFAGGSACCDSAGDKALAMKQELHCRLEEGVLLADDGSSVTISLGRRPTLGYRVRIEDQEVDGTEVYLGVREIKPASKGAVAQIMSSPCLTVTLPDDWTVLNVENTESERTMRFESGR